MRLASIGRRIGNAWSRGRPKTLVGWVHVASGVISALVVLAAMAFMFRAMFAETTTYGSHDWDAMESNRYIAVKTIRRFHQFPFWNPYACGGHPAWGGFEPDPNVVSPWLPVYLLARFPLALRVEVVGCTLVAAVGAWLFASRFTHSRALRALIAVLFSLNSRWTLQIAVGHMWHTTYAWMPWVLYFFDRAAGGAPLLGPPQRRDVVLAGCFLALLVYAGGIYPLPQTALIMVVYSGLLAAVTRSFLPFRRLAECGLLGLGLGAPRLLPVLELLGRYPRLVDSVETMNLGDFIAMLVSGQQDTVSMPAHVPQWGWHEWGMYIGWIPLVAIALGAVLARGTREQPLRLTGLLLVSLAFGRFFDYAPWPLLHLMPVFSSQHVPSRWMLPALLLLACVAASTAERLLRRTGRARALLEVAAVIGMAWLARDICKVDRVPLVHTFGRAPPAIADTVGDFRTEKHVPHAIDYDPGEWSPSTLSALIANVGTIDCNTFPAFNNYTRDHNGRAPGLGAHGVGEPQYRGEAFVAEGNGTARITKWSPNVVEVLVEGARPGDHVVLNQNWDPGWRANGSAAPAWHDTVSAVLVTGSESVRFQYRPRTLWFALLVFVVSCGAVAWPWLRRFVLRRAHSSFFGPSL
jgi:hypothetical protein